MHFCYGLADGSCTGARRFYEERFPNRRIPDSRMFARIHQRLRETGQLAPVRIEGGGHAPQRNAIDIEEIVIQRLEADQELSTRRLAAELGVSRMTIWRIIHDAGLYPYHFQRVQPLYPGDRERRREYCHWFLNQPRVNLRNFGWNVLFTDESEFTRNGINNLHNRHLYAEENPHGIIEARHQRKFSLNVWGGIVGDQLIGPFFLPPHLNGHNFLVNQLPVLLEDVPIDLRRHMWFMHDGAPAHFSLIVRNWLSQPFNYGLHWIGRDGPVAWPARSPDLNPLDFFLWGHCSALVYSTPVNDVDDLRQRIIDAFDTIRNTQGIFQRVNESV